MDSPLRSATFFATIALHFGRTVAADPATPAALGAQGPLVRQRRRDLSDHYYTHRPGAAHDETSFDTTLRGMGFRFVTDAGVFSRDRVDFGSLLLIEAMRVGPADVVLDLGCGYGPIGAVAARLAPQGYIYMVDVNERAVELARRNLALNGIRNAEVRVSDGLVAVPGIVFDTILTNPPIRAGKQTVYRLLDEAYAALRPGGALWVVVQNKQGAPSMKRKLQELFGNVTDVARKAGYHVFRAERQDVPKLGD